MADTRASGVHGGINDLPGDFTNGSDLGTSAWMAPSSGDVVYLPIGTDPQTGKTNHALRSLPHGSWLERHRKWISDRFGIDVDPVVETGWTAIQNGWIRKTGEPNALNYTVSANDLEKNLRMVSDDIWATVIHYQKKGKNPASIRSRIDIWSDANTVQPAGEFTIREFMENNGDISSLVSIPKPRRNRLASEMVSLAAMMDRRGQYDLADRLDDLISYYH
jgi:hypothetical protein